MCDLPLIVQIIQYTYILVSNYRITAGVCILFVSLSRLTDVGLYTVNTHRWFKVKQYYQGYCQPFLF